MQVAIVKTGTANLASVTSALNRQNVVSRIVNTPDDINSDDIVVLPGVGAFAAGMQTLNANGWPPILRERFEKKKPTLAICLGLQLLCRSSAESPDAQGLSILPVDVQALPDNVVVPHFGWNKIESTDDFFGQGYVYYANSFGIFDTQSLQSIDATFATTNHGKPFVAAIRKGPFVACQFHPELSGKFGQKIIANWLELAKESLSATEEDAKC